MTETDFAALEALIANAAPGPWTHHERKYWSEILDADGERVADVEFRSAVLVARARAVIPELIAEIRKLQGTS